MLFTVIGQSIVITAAVCCGSVHSAEEMKPVTVTQ